MERTLNQIKKDLQEIATQHRQINSFFFGDFVDAINQDAVDYTLMTATLQPGSMGDNFVTVSLSIVIGDKYNVDDYRTIDEVHSDCLQICNDIRITMKQNKFVNTFLLKATLQQRRSSIVVQTWLRVGQWT